MDAGVRAVTKRGNVANGATAERSCILEITEAFGIAGIPCAGNAGGMLNDPMGGIPSGAAYGGQDAAAAAS